MQRNTSYTNGLNEKLKKTYCQPALGLARQLAASSLPRRSLNIRWGSCRLKAFRPDMLRNRARDTSVHPRRAGRRQKGGGGGELRALRRVEALPQRPHLGGVDRGQRLPRIQRLLRIQRPQRFQRILPLQRLQRLQFTPTVNSRHRESRSCPLLEGLASVHHVDGALHASWRGHRY